MDISIIIPTHKRYNLLRQCLNSVLQQDYPLSEYEVIVVDDAQDDNVKVMLDQLREKYPNFRYLGQSHKGPAAARNLGVQFSSGEVVGFIDDDCVVSNGWLRSMMENHRANPNAAAVGGLTLTATLKTPVIVSQFLSTCSIETNINGNKEIIFFPTCNVSLKRRIFDRYKFDERFPLPGGEDLEFFWRLFKDGYRFIWDKDIKVIHYRDESVDSFMKQAYTYGRGNLLVKRIHKDHPLLKELKTGKISFWAASLINIIKIPRFFYLLGRSLVSSQEYLNYYKKFQIYTYFALHKIIYLVGNASEYLRTQKLISSALPVNMEKPKKINEKPELIILDISHKCNLQCNICEIRKDKPIKEYTLKDVSNIISQAIDWQVKEFALSGGEPLMREDLFEILDFVQTRKYHIGVLSNGVMLSDSFIKKLLPYLTSGSLSLCISLDALTASIHDEIRGVAGCFDKTSGAFKKLSELKKDYPGINFNSISIILNENLEELLDLSIFFKSLNINSIQFQSLLSNNLIMKERKNGVKYWVPPERFDLLDKTIDSLIEFKKENPLLVRNSEDNLRLMKRYFRGELNQEDVQCQYAQKTMLIANNGDLTTCFESYGNIRKNSLREIYASKSCNQARIRVGACKNPCLLPCFCD
jgi:MoaA/NifB/PqqE/SkfB family radical SAM enzyme/glycosyltransferase involved in cell wall biosynthesis